RDSHWNNVGAAMVSDALMTALKHGHRSYADEAYSERADFTGDLDKMLFPSAPTPEREAYYEQPPAFEYVTEGVESLEQYEFLERSGCDFIQGYLLSRPVPLDELRAVLDEINQRKPVLGVNPLSLARDTFAPASLDPSLKSLAPHAGASIVRPIR
ncbi:MAG: hypothetical protein ABS999_12295, partial [Pseudomonas atacamensis]